MLDRYPWRICVFDTYRVEVEGRVTHRFENRRQEALLALLVVHGGAAVARSEIAAELWPGKPEALATNRLTEVLVRLRRMLAELGMPEETVLSPRGVIQLNPSIATDVQAHAALLARAGDLREPSQAPALRASLAEVYGIGLLPLFTDEWAVRERRRFAALQAAALRQTESVVELAFAGQAVTSRAPAGWSTADRPPAIDADRPPSYAKDRPDIGPAPPPAVAEPPSRAPGWRDRLTGYVTLVEEASLEIWGPERERWLRVIEANLTAILECMELGLAAEELDPVARLAGAIWPIWVDHPQVDRGRVCMDRVLLALKPGTSAVYAKVLHGSGILALQQDDLGIARERLESALRIWQTIGNREWLARALGSLGVIAFRERDLTRSAEWHAESLTLLRGLNRSALTAIALKNAALTEMALGRYPSAETLLDEALQIAIASEDGAAIAGLRVDLSTVYQNLGRWPEARALAKQALEIYQDVADPAGHAYCLEVCGYLAHQAGELDAALEHFRQSELAFRAIGHMRGVAEVSFYRSALLQDLGDAEAAERSRAMSRDLYRALHDAHWQRVLEGPAKA